jgi:hypothetical protein
MTKKLGRPVEYTSPRSRVACRVDFRTKAFLEQRAKAKGMTEGKVVEMLTALYYYDTDVSKAFERVFHERGYDKISTIDGRVAVKQEMEKRR